MLTPALDSNRLCGGREHAPNQVRELWGENPSGVVSSGGYELSGFHLMPQPMAWWWGSGTLVPDKT